MIESKGESELYMLPLGYKLLENRINEQVRMILNIGTNKAGNFKNIEDLFEISAEVLDTILKEKNDISKTEIQLFKESLNNSLKLAKYNRKLISKQAKYDRILFLINGLKVNNNSFLIFPKSYITNKRYFLSSSHKVSILIRKKNDGTFSYVVNDKDKEYKSNSKEMLVEYIIPNKNKLLNLLVDSIKQPFDMFNQHILNNSLNRNKTNYNIPTMPQIISNCYLKEIEFGIKNAFLTRKNSFSDVEKNYLKSVEKLNTEDFHIGYVKKLLEKYKTQISKSFILSIKNLIDNYKENKFFQRELRKLLESTKTLKNDKLDQAITKQIPNLLKRSFKTNDIKIAFNKLNYSSYYKTIKSGEFFINIFGEKQGIIIMESYLKTIINLCKQYNVGKYKFDHGPIPKNAYLSVMENRHFKI
jgi:nicotinamide mononucleotide adenylyltransferase